MDRAPIAYVRDHYADDAGVRDAVWSGLGDLGACGLLVPEAHGGAGMGMVDAAVVLEELGRSVTPGPFVASAIAATSLLVALDAQDANLYGTLASGATVATVALLEPDRRAEWRSPITTAKQAGGSSDWRLEGEKVHVPDAGIADVLLVTASVGAELGVFRVDVGASGLVVTPTPTIDGTRAEASVTLDNTPATRLGDGDTTDAVAATVDRVAVATVVDGIGAASRALEISVEYAKEREQFGVPIGTFQAVQHLCADMLRAVELGRAAAYYACWACDHASPEERHRAATMALAFTCDELYAVGASAIQVHAGIGFTWEHDIHLFYKRLLTLQHAGGGSLDQLEELASIALAPAPDARA